MFCRFRVSRARTNVLQSFLPSPITSLVSFPYLKNSTRFIVDSAGNSNHSNLVASQPAENTTATTFTTSTTKTTATTPTVSTGKTTLESPYGSNYAKDPKAVIAVVLQALLGIVGAATLLMFIWGGFRLIFSEGNEEKITKSKAILVWATVGLAVVMASYSILSYTFNIIQKAATGAI